MRRWAAAALGFVVVVVALSGAEQWRYAFGGLFRPPDFAQDIAAARVFASDQNPYEVGIARTHAELLAIPEDEGYPHFPHPPLLFLARPPDSGLLAPACRARLVRCLARSVVPARCGHRRDMLSATWTGRRDPAGTVAPSSDARHEHRDGARDLPAARRLAAGALQPRQGSVVHSGRVPPGAVLAFLRPATSPTGRRHHWHRVRAQALSGAARALSPDARSTCGAFDGSRRRRGAGRSAALAGFRNAGGVSRPVEGEPCLLGDLPRRDVLAPRSARAHDGGRPVGASDRRGAGGSRCPGRGRVDRPRVAGGSRHMACTNRATAAKAHGSRHGSRCSWY